MNAKPQTSRGTAARYFPRRRRALFAAALVGGFGLAGPAHAQAPTRAVVLLPPIPVGESEVRTVARGAIDDDPQAEKFATTPVPQSPTGRPSGGPAWLTPDPNVRFAGTRVAQPTTGNSVVTASANLPNDPVMTKGTTPENGPSLFGRGLSKFKSLVVGDKSPAPAVQSGVAQAPVYRQAASAIAPVQGVSPNGAPVLAGPPAYRWYGYGSTTPGSNPYAPAGQYPRASANWYSMTGATPGAFPTLVAAQPQAAMGVDPPVYQPQTATRIHTVPAAAVAAPPAPGRLMPVAPTFSNVGQPLPQAIRPMPVAPKFSNVGQPVPQAVRPMPQAVRPMPVAPTFSNVGQPLPQAGPAYPARAPMFPASVPSTVTYPTALPQLPAPIHPPFPAGQPGAFAPRTNSQSVPNVAPKTFFAVNNNGPIAVSPRPMPAAAPAPLPLLAVTPMPMALPPLPPLPTALPTALPLLPTIQLPPIVAQTPPAVQAPAQPVAVPATDNHSWQAVPDKFGTDGGWAPSDGSVPRQQSRATEVNPEWHCRSAEAQPTIVRAQMADNRPEADPVGNLVRDLLRGRADSVEVRWTGSRRLSICFEVQDPKDGGRLVQELSRRRELAPFQVDFCVLVK